MAQNQVAWDLRTGVQVDSEFYDVASFKAGRSSLRRFEQEALGDVRGRSLPHLQCHFGLDTLSWAQPGRGPSEASSPRWPRQAYASKACQSLSTSAAVTPPWSPAPTASGASPAIPSRFSLPARHPRTGQEPGSRKRRPHTPQPASPSGRRRWRTSPGGSRSRDRRTRHPGAGRPTRSRVLWTRHRPGNTHP